MVETENDWLKTQMYFIQPLVWDVDKLNLHSELHDRSEEREFSEQHSLKVAEELSLILISPIVI